jgi:UDP-N-acetylglucosamine acyltransferase
VNVRVVKAAAAAAVHPTAIIDPGAEIADGVEIGPYAVIGPQVQIGAGCTIGAHTVISGRTRLGRENVIYQFASVGDAPQDKKYRGEDTALEIGDRNTVREFCTLNRGTVQDVGVTRIGSDNWIMAYVHIAHDCQIGSRTIFANNAQLAGHVHVGDEAVLGGFTVVHQRCRIGAHSLTAMGTILLKDLPPYVRASGNPARPHGINVEGLKRRGFTAPAITGLRRAYRTLYRSGLTAEAARAELAAHAADLPELEPLLAFLDTATRGIIR